MIETMQNHEIESLRPMRNPLDILAQIILSLTAIKDRTVESLFNSIRTAEPFANLPRRLFDLVVEMLTGKYEGTRIRELRPRLFLDESKGLLSPAKGLRYLLYLSGGTIPDRGQYNMKLADGMNNIGTLDEEFVWERSVGDRFELGTQTWEIRSIDHNNVVVMPTNAPPNIIPFWRAEDRSRDFTFSRAILRLFDHVQTKGTTKEEWGLMRLLPPAFCAFLPVKENRQELPCRENIASLSNISPNPLGRKACSGLCFTPSGGRRSTGPLHF